MPIMIDCAASDVTLASAWTIVEKTPKDMVSIIHGWEINNKEKVFQSLFCRLMILKL